MRGGGYMRAYQLVDNERSTIERMPFLYSGLWSGYFLAKAVPNRLAISKLYQL